MANVELVTIKDKLSVPLGLLCPECEGELYQSFDAMAQALDEPGYCGSCDYVGNKHGGFKPAVEEWVAELVKAVKDG